MLIAAALAYAGFTALGLSMQRHHREVFGRPPSRTVASGLRLLGYVLLALALWPCVIVFDASVGIVVWIGIVSASALMFAGLLAWKPRAAVWAGIAAPPAALILLL